MWQRVFRRFGGSWFLHCQEDSLSSSGCFSSWQDAHVIPTGSADLPCSGSDMRHTTVNYFTYCIRVTHTDQRLVTGPGRSSTPRLTTDWPSVATSLWPTAASCLRIGTPTMRSGCRMPTFSPLTVSFRGNYVKIRLYQRQSPWTWRLYVPPKRRRNGNYTVCKRKKPTATKVTVTVCQKFEWTNVTGSWLLLRCTILLSWVRSGVKGTPLLRGWEGGGEQTDRPAASQASSFPITRCKSNRRS